MNKIFAVLPCYNEAENIEALLRKWLAINSLLNEMNYSLQIVGIDDKSTDNTLTIFYDFAKEFKNIIVIPHTVNLGLGGGVTTAFKFFIKKGGPGDYCVLMDGDNSHDPQFIFSMLKRIEQNNCDCVIASRYCSDSITVGVPRYRLLLTFLARLYYKTILNVSNVNDYTCGYRLYSYDIIKKATEVFKGNLVTRSSFACMMEVLYKLHLVGCRFAEIPFELRYDNKKGQSKMRVLATIKESLFTALELRVHF